MRFPRGCPVPRGGRPAGARLAAARGRPSRACAAAGSRPWPASSACGVLRTKIGAARGRGTRHDRRPGGCQRAGPAAGAVRGGRSRPRRRASREVIELRLRQGLADSELAAVLGVSPRPGPPAAGPGQDRARVVPGRAARRPQPGAGTAVTWPACWRAGTGGSPPRCASRVHRHIEHCVTCGARRAAELNRGLLAGRPPGAALAAGAAESLRSGPGVPAELRARTIALAAGHGPGRGRLRLGRAGPDGALRPGGLSPGRWAPPVPVTGRRSSSPTAVLDRRRDGRGPGRRRRPGPAACRATRVPDRPVPGAPALAHRDASPAPPAAAGAGPRLVPGHQTVPLSDTPDHYGAGLNPTGYVEHMRDGDVVASIVAGEPDGLAVAYDRYAGDLYGYCLSLLREPDDAADAVQDTFVIAASKLAGLREPDRLRAWLFAVARNECPAPAEVPADRGVALQDAPELADDSADVGGAAERAETIALVRAAVGGLNDGERDVINQLWHGLEVPEVAESSGCRATTPTRCSPGPATSSRPPSPCCSSAAPGRRDCAALDGLLGDWDGRLTARLRKRVGRHIDHCRVCSDRRRRELTPAMLYSLTPGGAAGPGGAADDLPCSPPPAGAAAARGARQVLQLAADPARTRPASRRSRGEARTRSVPAVSPASAPRSPQRRCPAPPAAHRGRRYGGRGDRDRRGDGRRPHVPMPAGHRRAARRPPPSPRLAPGAPAPRRRGPPGRRVGDPERAQRQQPVRGRHGTRSARGSRPRGGAGPSSSPARGGAASAPAAARPPARRPRRRRGRPRRPSAATAADRRPATGVTATASRDGDRGAPARQRRGTLTVSPTTVLLSPAARRVDHADRQRRAGLLVDRRARQPARHADGGAVVGDAQRGRQRHGGDHRDRARSSLDTQLTVQPGGQAVTVVLGLGLG